MESTGPLDQILRLLLARHRAVLTPSPSALIRSDQVMLHGRGSVPAAVRRWVGEPVPAAPDVSRLPLLPGTGADVLSLLGDLTSDGAVAPIHLVQATPRFRGGPATAPEAVTALPTPPPPEGSAHPVTVAVLDTGIAPHPWFTDRPWFAEVTEDQLEVLDADRDDRLDVLAGHGTFVAGIITQHAPDARVVAVRLLSSDGICDEVELITALHALPPADVVNLSLGCHSWNDMASTALVAAIDRFGGDTVVVAAAGNDGDDRPFWPAAL